MIILNNVDLPAPLPPMMPATSLDLHLELQNECLLASRLASASRETHELIKEGPQATAVQASLAQHTLLPGLGTKVPCAAMRLAKFTFVQTLP